jgi:DNA helicase-2/ATP-dependent DNA helicase PcrA
VIGLDPEMTLPEADWVREQCRSRAMSFDATRSVQHALRVAKQQLADDAAVEQFLIRSGINAALEIERQRIAENRLTYDDLPRLAKLILANQSVTDLYRNHFAAVVVDEFQDLTPAATADRQPNRSRKEQPTLAISLKGSMVSPV